MYLKKSRFSDCWEVTSVIPTYKNVAERCTVKRYCPVNLLYVVSEVVEKLIFIINWSIDRLDKCGPFPDFQYDFMSLQPNADLLKNCI